jgi:hypothetical protein
VRDSSAILLLLYTTQKRQNPPRERYWEIIADNLSKAGWSLGWVSALHVQGQGVLRELVLRRCMRTIFVANAHRGDGKRFVVHADEKPTACVEREAAVRTCAELA